jgi:hypothetical protein
VLISTIPILPLRIPSCLAPILFLSGNLRCRRWFRLDWRVAFWRASGDSYIGLRSRRGRTQEGLGLLEHAGTLGHAKAIAVRRCPDHQYPQHGEPALACLCERYDLATKIITRRNIGVVPVQPTRQHFPSEQSAAVRGPLGLAMRTSSVSGPVRHVVPISSAARTPRPSNCAGSGRLAPLPSLGIGSAKIRLLPARASMLS